MAVILNGLKNTDPAGVNGETFSIQDSKLIKASEVI